MWVRSASGSSTVPTGTAMAHSNGHIGHGIGLGRPLQVVTVEAADGVRLRVLCSLNENLLATATGGTVQMAVDRVDGQIVIAPGQYVFISGEGDAGANSPLIHFSISWKEVPV